MGVGVMCVCGRGVPIPRKNMTVGSATLGQLAPTRHLHDHTLADLIVMKRHEEAAREGRKKEGGKKEEVKQAGVL